MNPKTCRCCNGEGYVPVYARTDDGEPGSHPKVEVVGMDPCGKCYTTGIASSWPEPGPTAA